MKFSFTLLILLLMLSCNNKPPNPPAVSGTNEFDSIPDTHIYGSVDLHGYILEKEVPENAIPNTTIRIYNLNGFLRDTLSNDSGRYALTLHFDERYEIFFEHPDYTTKFLVLDTRFIDETHKKDGYKMPTDMSLEAFESAKANRLLTMLPIGIARADESNFLDWDFAHTERIKRRLAYIKSHSLE